LGVDAGRDELSVTAAEAEIGYYQGEGLLLEDVLREQVLLALPLKVTCRADCKGLCPHCGKNLNHEQCSCSTELEDPRWAALKDVRSRLER
ncbi:MAG: YceD family protein, partial [Candidatus Angelobacter sp.]